METIIFILGYLACSILSFGILFAYFRGWYGRNDFYYFDDMKMSLFWSSLGPISLLGALIYVYIIGKGYKGVRFW